jgi:hypothetical protein
MSRPWPTTRRETCGKCGSNRCLGKASSGMGCGAFAYDGTGHVNGFALVIASGQNLKRLLQKQGWGRRPFPTEAMALMPPAKRETEASFSTRTRTPLSRAVAVTFTTLFNSSTTCFPTRKGWFFSTSSQLFLACHKEEDIRVTAPSFLWLFLFSG